MQYPGIFDPRIIWYLLNVNTGKNFNINPFTDLGQSECKIFFFRFLKK